MSRSIYSCALAISLTCGFVSEADTEFQGSIPVETVKALFNAYGDNQFEVYEDIIEAFPEFPVPNEFSVVGSVSYMSSLRIVFQTDLSEQAAMQLLKQAFDPAEWTPFPIFRPSRQQVGFITPGALAISPREILCHDDHGNLTISYFSQGGMNYISTSVPRIISMQQTTCDQQIQMQQQSSMGRMPQPGGLRQYLPRMEIPESQSLRRRSAFLSSGSSFSGNTIETDGMMTSDEGIDAIYGFIAEQIQSQDWELDSESIGSRSATGTWIKSPTADLDLVGTLSIIALGNEEFELRFRMAAEGSTSNYIFGPLQ